MFKIDKKDLMDYVFGPDGLDFKSKDINKNLLITWLMAQDEMLEDIKQYFEDHPDSVTENVLGHVPYALGDLQNFLKMITDKIKSTEK